MGLAQEGEGVPVLCRPPACQLGQSHRGVAASFSVSRSPGHGVQSEWPQQPRQGDGPCTRSAVACLAFSVPREWLVRPGRALGRGVGGVSADAVVTELRPWP